jgi:peptidoglycan/xylan/chitin deacetylase (PgdA/CDA1 family)
MIIKRLFMLFATLVLGVGMAASSLTKAPLVHATTVGSNLIPNPSVEQAANSTTPAGWQSDQWGTNKTTFKYITTSGHTGTHSVQVSMSSYSSGDADWQTSSPVAVAANTNYTYSDWYESNVATDVDLMTTNASGQVAYYWLGTVAASSAWKQAAYEFQTPAGTTSVTVYHLIYAKGQLTTDDYDLNQVVPGTTPPPATPNPVLQPAPTTTTGPTAPSVQVTAPGSGTTVSGTTGVTANATDAQGISSVQFELNGKALGSPVTKAPYTTSWNTTSVANGQYTLTAVATNVDSLTTTSTPVTVTVSNAPTPPPPTAPSVQITVPTANATVSGSQTITATASDAQGISNVQFELNGKALGSPDTTSPYSTSWNTTSVANGQYTLTAVATNIDNLTTTSAPITVTVSNTVTTPPTPTGPTLGANLIANPSAETSTGGAPNNWTEDGWGTNSPTYTYLNTGHTGSHSLQITMNSYTSGDADWSPDPVTVTPNGTYLFSDWYESNTNTEIDAAVTLSDGTTEYEYVQTVMPATTWTQLHDEWDAPANAVSVTFYHLIQSTGTLTTDDYSLQSYTPTPFNRGLVSVSLDDGYENAYTDALPILQKYDVPATFYIITGEQTNVGDEPHYMTTAQVQDLYNDGEEIASHTVTHPDLTTVSASQLQTELQQSQQTLEALTGGVPVNDLAYPDGAYNATVAAAAAQYYSVIRGIEPGFNTKDYTNFLDVKAQSVDDTTTPAQVEAWVNEAYQQKTWLVLIYHEVANTPTYASDALYTTNDADFTTEMSYIHSSGITPETIQQAANEVKPQL